MWAGVRPPGVLMPTARRLADASGDRAPAVWVRAQEARGAFFDDRDPRFVLRIADEAVDLAQGTPSAGPAVAYGIRSTALAAQGQKDRGPRGARPVVRGAHRRPRRPGDVALGAAVWIRRWSCLRPARRPPRAAAALERVAAGCAAEPDSRGPLADLHFIQALALARDRRIGDGLMPALSTAEGMGMSAPRRRIAGRILDALPAQARTSPAAQTLGSDRRPGPGRLAVAAGWSPPRAARCLSRYGVVSYRPWAGCCGGRRPPG